MDAYTPAPAAAGAKPATVGFQLRAILVAIATCAVAVPALIVQRAPTVVPARQVVGDPPRRVVPQAEIPPVEPIQYRDLAPDDARAFNATVPLSTDPNPAAKPFFLTGSDEDKARAIDCMAAGVLYEAGDDTLGQRSVAQVIINRARHPAFPKTICGVIFQGQERATGCQFTFTCDGALMRHHWSEIAWKRARETAAAALAGSVFAAVGYATHYHTDWVVPYWQSSLDKVAKVRTHLFFRWTGWWGTPPAFNRRVSPTEPGIAQLARLSDAHKMGAAMTDAVAAAIEAAHVLNGGPQPLLTDFDSFLITLDPKMPAASYAAFAARACDDREYCKFMGWTAKARTPNALPLQPAQIATMSFSYLRDRARGYDKALWNCAEFQRADPNECMKVQTFLPNRRSIDDFRLEDTSGAHVIPPPVVSTRPAADGLSGVRRRVEISATPVARATPPPARAVPVVPRPAATPAIVGR